MIKPYFEKIDVLYEKFSTSENGLTQNEANERLEKFGKNKLDEEKKESIFSKFINQLKDPMIIILIIAACISSVISFINKENMTDVFIILFVVILNAILGLIQEEKAENAIMALKNLTKAKSKVLRDGKITIINSEDLVVGDVIILEAGDNIGADARILESNQLKTEEASLTGESLPIEKIYDLALEYEGIEEQDIPLGDRKNMVYMGTNCVYGRGKALVIATGMNTEMGYIAKAITDVKEEKTPLQVKLNELSKILTISIVGICIFIFAFAVIKQGSFDFSKVVLPSFMVAISLAVAAIPEGLSAVVTIVLSIGVTKMSNKKAVIRKLTAVETLGCTEVICSDKTGTLTQNKMTVVENFTYDLNLLCKSFALSSDAYIDNGIAKGEPTECALVDYAYKNNFDKNKINETRLAEIPFDSTRKMMTTFYGNTQYTKGALDVLIERCTKIWKNGKEEILTSEDKKQIIDANKQMTSKALRVLSVAFKSVNTIPTKLDSKEVEKDLTFIGIVGMIDPIREEVKQSIADCKKANIKTIMITGDHKDTAVAIAKSLGILNDETEALTGLEIDKMSDEELEKNIERYSVYARVKPEHKVRIVSAWKNAGKIVAMTGDGVNDAPSIKNADIGIGMGITGTDVTKNVSDMVLSDDNFATIVNAIEEGRIIFANIKKAIIFLLSSNLSEVVTIFTATMIGFTILKAPHLLWINLITDCFPALSLGMEEKENDIMMEAPRKKTEGIFSNGAASDVIYQGIMVSILTLVAYYLGSHTLFDPLCGTKEMQGMTMAFLTMSMAEIFHAFNMRSLTKSIFKLNKQNIYLIGSMIISLLLTYLVIEIKPIAELFNFANIDLVEYVVALGLAILVIPIVEIVKLCKYHKN